MPWPGYVWRAQRHGLVCVSNLLSEFYAAYGAHSEWDQAKPAGPVGICAIGVQGSAYK